MNDIYKFAILTLKWQLAECMLACDQNGVRSCLESIRLLQLYSSFDAIPFQAADAQSTQSQAAH